MLNIQKKRQSGDLLIYAALMCLYLVSWNCSFQFQSTAQETESLPLFNGIEQDQFSVFQEQENNNYEIFNYEKEKSLDAVDSFMIDDNYYYDSREQPLIKSQYQVKKVKTNEYSYRMENEYFEEKKAVNFQDHKNMDFVSTGNEESDLPLDDHKHFHKNKQNIGKIDLQRQFELLKTMQPTTLLQEFTSDARLLYDNQWRPSKRKLNQSHQAKQKKQKMAISKLESWDSHLKSLRTHYLQQLFNEFQERMWKVPNQKLIRHWAFKGTKDNQYEKLLLLNFLEQRQIVIQKQYDHFPMKREFYCAVIQEFINSLNLALEFEGQIDDLVYEVLFKVRIKTLFE